MTEGNFGRVGLFFDFLRVEIGGGLYRLFINGDKVLRRFLGKDCVIGLMDNL